MFVNLRYDSEKEFGTGYSTDEYRASISKTKDELGVASVNIEFEFTGDVHGRSHSKSRPESLTLMLTESEALKLASAIFAHSHHPILRGKKTEWMDPRYMHRLDQTYWADKVIVNGHGKVLTVYNRTKAHLGFITVDVSYGRLLQPGIVDSELETIRVRKEVDLQPNSSCNIELTKIDLQVKSLSPEIKIVKAVVHEVTGLLPS